MALVILILSAFFIVLGVLISAVLKTKLSRKKYNLSLKIIVTVLLLAYAFTGNLVYKNNQPNSLIIEDDYIEFTGSYGLKIQFEDIKNIQQATLIPEIESRIKGFSLLDIRKGVFETPSGKKVYLLINGTTKPILKITKKDKQEIYFNSQKNGIVGEYNKLQYIFSYQKK